MVLFFPGGHLFLGTATGSLFEWRMRLLLALAIVDDLPGAAALEQVGATMHQDSINTTNSLVLALHGFVARNGVIPKSTDQ